MSVLWVSGESHRQDKVSALTAQQSSGGDRIINGGKCQEVNKMRQKNGRLLY